MSGRKWDKAQEMYLNGAMGYVILLTGVGISLIVYDDTRAGYVLQMLLTSACLFAMAMGAFAVVQMGRNPKLSVAALAVATLMCVAAPLHSLAGYFIPDIMFHRLYGLTFELLLDGFLLALWLGGLAFAAAPRPQGFAKVLQRGTILMLVLLGAVALGTKFFILDWQTWGYRTLFPQVLAFAGFAAMYVMHRLAATRQRKEPLEGVGALRLVCPRCSMEQTVATGTGCCAGCRAGFHVEVVEGRCGTCGYALRGLTSQQCPECVTALPPTGVPVVGATVAAEEPAAVLSDQAEGGRV